MKSLPQWSATALLTAPVGALALGIGDIELHSALNQPFQAEIELLSVTAEELEGLRVSLAGRDTYQRLDLDRPAALSALNFSVARNNAGQPVIRVTSREPIPEPFLTILLEVNYPSGRSLREYTVLLDPPVFTPSELGGQAPVRAAQANTPSSASGAVDRAPAETVARTPAPQAASRPATAAPASSAAVGDAYGPVQNAETLWSIASQLRPSDVSVNQMMVALYEANPSAFDGNMNRLLRGATLAIPDRSRLVARTPAEATAEVRRQESALGGAGAPAVAAAPAAGAAAQGGAQSARLRLVAPSTDSVIGESSAGGASAPTTGAGAGGGAGGAGSANVDRLETEVASLRAELEESRRLLQLRDEQLQALQSQLAGASAAGASAAPAVASSAAMPGVELESEPLFADEATGDGAPIDEASVEDPAVPASGAAATATADAESDTQAEDAGPAAETATVAATTAGAQAVDASANAQSTSPAARTAAGADEPSLVSRVLGVLASPFVWMAVGVGLVLTIALLYFRGRREEDAEDVTGRWDALEAEVEQDERDATARLGRPSREQSLVVEEQPARPAAASAEAAEAAGALDDSGTFSSQTVINLDQGDPIAEADFHLAYGLYDQAAELVQNAIDAEPQRRDLKLKLLEVFFVWGNKDAFREAASRFQGEAAGNDWDKVVIMGRQLCPDDTLFTDAGSGAGLGVDLDLESTGNTEVDFAFDDQGSTSKAQSGVDLDFESTDSADRLDFELAATGEHIGGVDDADESGVHDLSGLDDDDLLDIGAQTAAGLEAALASEDDDDLFAGDDTGAALASEDDDDLLGHDDTGAAEALDDDTVETGFGARDSFGAVDDELDIDAMSATQESPTVESPSAGFDDDWAASLGLDDTGSELTLDDDDDLTRDGDGEELSVGSDRELTRDGAGELTLDGDSEFTLDGDGELSLDATVEQFGNSEDSLTIESFGGELDSPTVETFGAEESPTVEAFGGESPTVETPTIESPWPGADMLDADAPTMVTPSLDEGTQRLEVDAADDSNVAFLEPGGEHTEEIHLDDLGLSAEELSGLDGLADLGDSDGDTREQPALTLDDEDLLSATGVTEIGDDDDFEVTGTAVLGENDLTMLAPRDDAPFGGTEVIERADDDDEDGISGATSLLETLEGGEYDFGDSTGNGLDGVDLDLDDLASALASGEGDTVEQPRESFDDGAFDGGSTPLDLDIGYDMVGSDDPTGTEDMGALDPHTMTEIGTKLDLARAYIDMGDPEGARSILEEVIDEGDAGQKREAQGLIESLGA